MEKTHTYERKWRRINPYLCAKCGKPRYSFIFSRAKEKLCRSCARNAVPDNQPSLFIGIDPAAPNGDYGAEVIGEKKTDGTIEIKSVKFKKPKDILTPREAAKELIRVEVLRGDSCSDINSTYVGHGCKRYMARIISGAKIEVEEINNKPLDPTVIFKLKEIYNEIVMDNKKHEKCGCDRNKIIAGMNKQALGRGDYENKKLEKDIIKIAFGRKKKK